MAPLESPRIAVLINTPPDNLDFWTNTRESWKEAIALTSPTAKVEFFDPVVERKMPNAPDYDLIVLSGGKADASSSEPWVLGVLDYVRETAREFPQTKILGVCWGHQAVLRAFGGEVGPVATGPIAAIEDIRLTEAGMKFFEFAASAKHYRAPEFHVREVLLPAPGFIHLAENHECFIHEQNNILTFQAHPELSNELAKKLLLEEDKVYNGNSSANKLEHEVQKLTQPTDGLKLLSRVIHWIAE